MEIEGINLNSNLFSKEVTGDLISEEPLLVDVVQIGNKRGTFRKFKAEGRLTANSVALACRKSPFEVAISDLFKKNCRDGYMGEVEKQLIQLKANGIDLEKNLGLFSEGLEELAKKLDVKNLQFLLDRFPEFKKIQAKTVGDMIVASMPEYYKQEEKNNLPFIQFLKTHADNYNHLTRKDLSRVNYSIFNKLIAFDEPIKNKIAMDLIQLLLIDHPNADRSCENLLELIENSSWHIETLKFLKDSHPAWAQISPDGFAHVIQELLKNGIGYPGFVDPVEYKAKALAFKKEAFAFLVGEVPQSDWSSQNLADIVSELAHNTDQEQEAFFKWFQDSPSWEAMSPAMVAKILRSAADNFEPWPSYCLFSMLKKHPQYSSISRVSYVEIMDYLLSECCVTYVRDPEREQFTKKMATNLAQEWMNHPRWADLTTSNLANFAKLCPDELLAPLSEHPKWKEMPPYLLASIFSESRHISISSVEIFSSHPNWNKIPKSDLVGIAIHAIHSILPPINPAVVALIQAISQHPQWKNFTQRDLKSIAREMQDWKYSPEIEEILKSHPNLK